MQSKKNLQALRQAMQAHNIQGYIVFSADPHLSEYLPAHWQQRAWLSGFDGSAGFLAITQDEAALWTDSRYWEQAGQQLQDSGFSLQKLGQAKTPSLCSWLAQYLQPGDNVACDGMTLSLALYQQLSEQLQAKHLQFQTSVDLLKSIWQDRPRLSQAAIYAHESQYVGHSRAQKLQMVRDAMSQQGCRWHLISSLDDMAWCLNLRGSDVDYNPVFLGHLLIAQERAYLHVNPEQLDDKIIQALQADGVEVLAYEAIAHTLEQIQQDTLLVDANRVVFGLVQPYMGQLQQALNPSQRFKALKTPDEIAHVRQAMIQDGIALCQFFSDFEHQLQSGKTLTELDVDEQLTAYRAQDPNFVSLSFATIAGFNGNGALPHYRATPQSHAVIQGNGLLLIDSGAQYLNGTTDITRVIPIGKPSKAQKRDFTIVLKGMIQLSQAVFPSNIPAPLLDMYARQPLWQAGLDFGHGTGHGVGYFLNVHEGPQVIAHPAYQRPHTAMRDGMITSNEPGLYRPHEWGIRIENLMYCYAAETTEFGQFSRFETLTLCPIDSRCIDLKLMSHEEIEWLNQYHAMVYERLHGSLKGAALEWLTERCQEL
ncbi:aminopeptidase P family protein [Brackiella oedipodis]|uniref:aminopeptidase P family protein n=1 Tax=Brackiella oedipodis TaxID=124225 RepID=UPI00056F3FB0|nr:aminopeptidase P family protein [Brackiella oedipodis]